MSGRAFHDAARLVRQARCPADLFGADPAEATRAYRRLAAALHPDRVGEASRGAAGTAFVRLGELWHQWRCAGTAGTAGMAGTIATEDAEYRIGKLAFTGDVANLYTTGIPDGYLKIPREPADSDLLEREARALRVLAGAGDPRYLPYVPRVVDSFRHRDPASGARRRVSVLAAAGGLHSLAEVRARYPDGVDGADAAWMWRRLLVALGFAHRAGVLHGAVLPEHVLIQPAGHGVVLVGWGHAAVGPGQRIPALVTSRRDWYPAEVLDRAEPGPGTDLAMAARCMEYLMGGRAPAALRAFAAGCAQPALRNRPDDAWRLLHELDGLLERLYGPRKFRPFTL